MEVGNSQRSPPSHDLCISVIILIKALPEVLYFQGRTHNNIKNIPISRTAKLKKNSSCAFASHTRELYRKGEIRIDHFSSSTANASEIVTVNFISTHICTLICRHLKLLNRIHQSCRCGREIIYYKFYNLIIQF